MNRSLLNQSNRLITVYDAFAKDDPRYKVNLSPQDVLWLLGWPWFWPDPFKALTNALLDEGFVLVPLHDRFQLLPKDAIFRLRKLPSGKEQVIIEVQPELADKPAEIIRQLYETRFNNKLRGPFYANRGDIAQICDVPFLTPDVFYSLSRELDQLPLARPQKTVVHGYQLVNALDYIAVVEKKLIYRNSLLTRKKIREVTGIDS